METVMEIDYKWGANLSMSVFDEIYEKYSLERYLNRTEILIRVSKPDKQMNYNDLWMRIVAQRRQEGRKISLKDQKGNDFWYVMTSHGEKKLQDIDNMGREKLEELTAKETRKLLMADMMIEEAFYSSVIEGAFSTKKRTKELIKTKDPKDKSEQMILNNYQCMIFSMENINEDLSEELFIAMHKIITYETLEPDEITEKYRNDIVFVADPNKSEPIYTPPKAEDIQGHMDDLFLFIAEQPDENDIHPLVKAAIIHFYIGYVHPFFDGNGRVARVFAYLYLLKNGYDFFKFFSISSIIHKHRGKYYKAFKDTEDNGSDLTYFIITQLEIILESITIVVDKLMAKLQKELLKEELIKDGIVLSDRQEKFLNFMDRKDNNLATIKGYQKQLKVSYETGRRELSELAQLGLFRKAKKGREFIYKYVGAKGYFSE